MADLDDFFAKKDKKKPGKKGESMILKTTDLFKVLDSAAQNVAWEDENEGRRKEVQLGPVLSEVLKPEEASKWEEPVEEERQYDFTNLKIESLQTLDEYEEAAEKAVQEASKPTKTWDVPKKEKPKPPPEKQEDLKDSHGGHLKDPSGEVNPDQGRPSEDDSRAKNIGSGDGERTLGDATKDGPVEPSKDNVIDAKNSDNQPVIEEQRVAVAETSKPPEPAADTPASGPPKYVPPALRAAQEAAAKQASQTPRPAPSEQPKSAPSSASTGGTGVYISTGRRKAMEEEEAAKAGGGSSHRLHSKKPELDNEQEFPSLGGPSKHK